ncbi:MAG TPA: hypothetical protein ENN80_02665, partial [Candidatus Hydrogenedentes bacterium]|nr:hypothetical protein [Candidatus Hydrogenedentota bacterium]
QRHEIPADPNRVAVLARRLGYVSGETFMAVYADRARETRAILERFVAAEGAGHQWIGNLLDPRSDGANGRAHLERLGFKDPAKAREELLHLCNGPEERPFSQHVRRQFAAIAPRLIDALARTPNPDVALLRLERVLSNLRAPTAIYEILKWEPELAGHLVTLAANSDYLSEILVRDPGLFDLLGARGAAGALVSRADLERQLESLSRAYDPAAAPYRLRDGELLRIGLRELLDDVSVVTAGEELTGLAEVCIAYALEQARSSVAERYGAAEGAFVILAMGKLGGREMTYGSDLDLVFVYDARARLPDGVSRIEYYTALASQTIRGLQESTRYGRLYEVDARLRPDGNKGVLAIDGERIEQYYRQEAQAWERLALVKIRAVAGDPTFGRHVERRARELAFALPLDAENLAQMEAIRSKLSAGASERDIKRAQGGLAEVEFAVRFLQLRHAEAYPELQRGDVAGALEVLARHHIAAQRDLDTLSKAYYLFRRIENRIRMMHGRSDSALPESPEACADLAMRLRLDPDLPGLVAEHKARVHELYQRLQGSLLENPRAGG